MDQVRARGADPAAAPRRSPVTPTRWSARRNTHPMQLPSAAREEGYEVDPGSTQW